ncbi:hypothetical protein LP420_04475 [Massilia sp. B-10]|nr:hypothetical protein LP420_04475 [Massilia sp. B-10]
MPHVGQFVPFAAAVEQGGAELRFEPVDPARDGGVLDLSRRDAPDRVPARASSR